jgi:hypothetical protein
MTDLQNLTVAQLQRVVSIKEKIESLTAELEAIAGGEANALSPAPVKRRGAYKRSKAARAAMAAAQKARWAKVRGTETEAAPKKRRKMSASAKAKMAAAAKARWAKVKAAGKNSL